MIPPKNDPKWQEIVKHRCREKFFSLPTQMLMMRVYLLTLDGTAQKIQEAVDVVYEFFVKNEDMVKEDLMQLFNEHNSKESL